MKVNLELLSHFNCDACTKWWSISESNLTGCKVGDEFYCPHCGTKNIIGSIDGLVMQLSTDYKHEFNRLLVLVQQFLLVTESTGANEILSSAIDTYSSNGLLDNAIVYDNKMDKILAALISCKQNFEKNKTGGCNGADKTPEKEGPYAKILIALKIANYGK